MASERHTINREQGVTIEEISLRNNGAVVDRAYIVKTLRTPETWSFGNKTEAMTRFHDEVKMCANDSFVQSRLGH